MSMNNLFLIGSMILLVIFIIISKKYRAKLEQANKSLQEKTNELEVFEEIYKLDLLKDKADTGDVNAQVELCQAYLDSWRESKSDLDMREKFYWQWVSIYNGGNQNALSALTDDINMHLNYVNTTEDKEQHEFSTNILHTIQQAEKDAYRDRTLYKNRFPNDIGNTPDMIEMHKTMENWDY